MKKSIAKSVLATIIVAFAALICSVPSQAQLRFGVKVGLDVNKLHFNENVLSNDNRAGFTGGVMMEFTAPIIGVGFDLSAMYVRRTLRAQYDDITATGDVTQTLTSHRDYIEIPLNLKYKIGIPGLSKILTPFVTTGPSVAFLTSRTAISEAWKNKNVDCCWNFGFGAEIISRVQLHASYGLGLSNSVVSTLTNGQVNNTSIDGKTRCWTITAAYLF